jgi:hypothetical protein
MPGCESTRYGDIGLYPTTRFDKFGLTGEARAHLAARTAAVRFGRIEEDLISAVGVWATVISVPLEVVSKRLGHSNSGITAERYLRVYSDQEATAATVFDTLEQRRLRNQLENVVNGPGPVGMARTPSVKQGRIK